MTLRRLPVLLLALLLPPSVVAHRTRSMDRGAVCLDNVVTHLAAAVGKVGSWQPAMRLNETTTAFFRRLAAISPPEEAYLFTHLQDPAVQEKLRANWLRYNSMLRTSIVPTIITRAVSART